MADSSSSTRPIEQPSEYFGPSLETCETADTAATWDGFLHAVHIHFDELALVCTHQPPGLFGLRSVSSGSPAEATDIADIGGEANMTSAAKPPPYLRWTFGTLHHGILQLLRGLGDKAKVTPDTKYATALPQSTAVVTFLHNCAEFILTAWAAVAAGGILVPLNPSNLNNRDEVSHMLRIALRSVEERKCTSIIVVAQDQHTAKLVDSLDQAIFSKPTVRVLASGSEAHDGWFPFEAIMRWGSSITTTTSMHSQNCHLSAGLILFTSGTTSRPKGLYIHHHTIDKFTRSRLLLSSPELLPGPGCRLCSTLPNNHGNGWSSIQATLGRGAALVFPGSKFCGPEAMIDVMHTEMITHTFLVTTLVHPLAMIVEKQQKPLKHLRSITFGGMLLDRRALRAAVQILGAKSVENAYGCTEGVLLSTGCVRADASQWPLLEEMIGISEGGEISVGRAPAGHGIRIVDPENGTIVSRNTCGEIWGCGPMVQGDGNAGYIQERDQRSFYKDDTTGIIWFRTGDMGSMDGSGRIYVRGRYKDMIVRGGENIAPLAIERVLNGIPNLHALGPQVVGARDNIAGEVPVVIVDGPVPGPDLVELAQKTILQRMGPMYLPKAILSLQADLKLESYPRTTVGKIQKSKLQHQVEHYFLQQENKSMCESQVRTTSEHDISERVKSAWAQAIGLDSSAYIRDDTLLEDIADSIIIMQVRNKLDKQTGVAIPLKAIMEARFISDVVDLFRMALETGSRQPRLSKSSNSSMQRSNKWTVVDPLVAGRSPQMSADPQLQEQLKPLVENALSPHGLSWSHVEDILPAYDANGIQAQCGLYDTINFNLLYVPSVTITAEELRRAIEAVMLNHRILRSYMIWRHDWRTKIEVEDAYHVIILPSTDFFNIAIQERGHVANFRDLEAIALGSEVPGHKAIPPEQCTFPGPLYRAFLFKIDETHNWAVILNINHAISDHTAGSIIQDDLDRAIALATEWGIGEAKRTSMEIYMRLAPHQDYQIYLDLQRALYHSPQARASIQWHIDRLKRLPAHVDAGALWPPPAFHEAGPDQLRTHYRHTNQIQYDLDVPGLKHLRSEHQHITACTVVKTAVALASAGRNTYTSIRSGSADICKVSVFTSVEAARTHLCPFMPEIITGNISAALDWEATDVAGPTVQLVCNVVEIPTKKKSETNALESVIEFLDKMQTEQTEQTVHASAPWRAISIGLQDPSADKRRMPLLALVHATLMFNWAPNMGAAGSDPEDSGTKDPGTKDPRMLSSSHFSSITSVQKPLVGLVVTAGVRHRGPTESSRVTLLLRGAGLPWDEIQKFAEEIANMIRWLVHGDNQRKDIAEALSVNK